jgi:hypothetical protein
VFEGVELVENARASGVFSAGRFVAASLFLFFRVSASGDEANTATSANSATDAQNRRKRNVGPGHLRARNIATQALRRGLRIR